MDIRDDIKRLQEADKSFIWHPFTQMKDWLKETPVIIDQGRDCFIRDVSGKWYLDGVSSLWVNIFGHRKKEIDDAIRAQLDSISHSTLLGLSNVQAIRLAERLVKIAQLPATKAEGGEAAQAVSGNGRLSKVFYSDNGSTAVEVALKMAFQYWRHRGAEGRQSFLSLNNAYHGDTLGAVSVGGVDIFHKTFAPLLFKTYKAPSPYCYRCELGMEFPGCGIACAEKMGTILEAHGREIAAVIVEPLVQAAGGMIVSPPGYLARVRELCTRHDVLMIADEVATGFGRTGEMFACWHEGVVPDIMCLSKGITGGYLPLAATLAAGKVYDAFLGEFSELKTFFHGHSYTGNPLACAAALACLDLFETEKTIEGMQPRVRLLGEHLSRMAELPYVGDVRYKGLMAGVELVRDKKTKEPYPWEEKMGWQVAYQARDRGVIIRPLGNVVVIMPPLSISMENLEQLLRVIRESIARATEGGE